MNAVTHLEKVIVGEVSAVTHLEKVIAGETSAVTYTEKVITGEALPITHLQKVIAGVESPVTHLEYVWAGGSPTPTEHEYTGAVPYTFRADGSPLISWRISGNTVQSGTPTPDNPIQPQGTGERTGNLWAGDVPRYEYIKDYKKYNPDNAVYIKAGTYTISSDGKLPNFQAFDDNHTQYSISEIMTFPTSAYYPVWDRLSISPISAAIHTATITILADCIITLTVVENLGTYIMLNAGSTALPYEPYGYKIPISSANTTTPVYLGEVETTRKIKKYEFTGTESISSNTLGVSKVGFTIAISDMLSNGRKNGYCTHFVAQNSPSGSSLDGITYGVSDKVLYVTFSVATATAYNLTDVTSVKTWLSQQYANGTPVTVWYVLATEETGIVNEPIRKIGDYADTLSMEQAGVSIPTNNGSTTVDVETTLKPSEVYIKYKGV